MGRKTRGVIRKKKDYTKLLLELQGQRIPSSPKQTAVNPEQRTPFSPYRQRIMSDETIKYLYSRKGGTFHDKSCPEAQKIPDDELCYAKEYLTDIPQCPLCKVKAYVRLGAKDLYNFHLYERLFERMKFSPPLVRRMYVREKMKTSASHNGLTIWGKEDSWRLEFWDGSNTMRLMHNNYHSFPDGTRVFTHGYHVQVERATPLHALTMIAGYSYESHKAAMRRREQELLKQLTLQELPEEPPAKEIRVPKIWGKLLSILEKSKRWLRKVFRK